MLNTNAKITAIRELMKKANVSAYLITDSDPHISEYVPNHYRERSFVSGFTGSAGSAVITQTAAGLWTDGRYYLQAENQLAGSEVQLYKASDVGVISTEDYLLQNVKKGETVAVNGKIFSAAQFLKLKEKLEDAGINLSAEADFAEKVWGQTRPELSPVPAAVYPTEFAGESTAQKLVRVREKMQQNGGDYLLICALDEVNWFLNIRGEDVENTPVVSAFVFVGRNTLEVYIEDHKCDAAAKAYFESLGAEVYGYWKIFERSSKFTKNDTVMLSAATTNALLYSIIAENASVKPLARTYVSSFKSCKNETEMKYARQRQIQDGAVVAKMIYWLTNAVKNGENLDECDVADKLIELRSAQEGFFSPSFDTIAGYGPNGAIVHYSAKKESCLKLKNESIILVDSGGQYYGATTDITRTFALGPVTAQQKTDYTLVLKSFVNLQMVKFLQGTAGKHLDILSRQVMWEHGIDYKHGTGHGVGSFLGVHESPPNFADITTPFEEGMIISVEPGIYRQNSHGIRIENLVMAVKEQYVEGSGQYYRFETLTQCPVDRNLIDKTLLSEKETAWINAYHEGVYAKINEYMTDAEKEWLKTATAAL